MNTDVRLSLVDAASARTVSAPRPRRTTGASTLAEMALAAADRYSGPALRFKQGGRWHDISHPELGEIVTEIAAGLMACGVESGDRLAIFSSTRPEWTMVDLGALCAGAVVVPVYHTSSAEECEHVLGHSGARVVICEGPREVEMVRGLDAAAAIDSIVSIDPADAPSLVDLRGHGAEVGLGEVRERAASVRPDDLCTIVYTSGTTGSPKGCMLTHRNYRANSDMCAAAVDLADDAVVFVFLPLAHSMTRVVSMYTLDQGHTLAYWTGDMARVMSDVAECRPTDLPSVPRLFEKIHATATATGGPRRRMLDWAVSAGRRAREGERPGAALRARHALADRLVLRRIRELFGGRLRMVFSGGAPIAPETLEFFDACGLTVLEGYGLTETSAAATMNTPDELRFGTVGRPLDGCKVEIAADGEVTIAGPHVFAGYYRDAEATASALRGGWLATGDLGELDDGGFLRITGRKKDLIVTASGKNVAPAAIEEALCRSRWISQAVAVGDRKPYVAALLTLDPGQAPALAERAGVPPAEVADLARAPAVLEELQRAVDEVNDRFARAEQVKRFELLPRELTQEDGELTPTLKVKRPAVVERYAAEVDRLFA
jgi:long-chain acyl-CoA synthetase